MGTTQSLKDAGLLVYTDEVMQSHLRYLPESRARARRFELLQSLVAKKRHDMPGVYAARLVLLDLVQPSQLLNALSSTPFLHLGHVYVDWTIADPAVPEEKSRIDRRRLSNSTRLSFEFRNTETQVEIKHFKSLVLGCGLHGGVKEENLLEELERDLHCWVPRNLSGPLWAHVMRIQVIWAVNRETLGRLSSQKVRVPDFAGSSFTDIAVAEFTDAALAASAHATADQQPHVLLRAMEFISFSSLEDSSVTLDRWLNDLLTLKSSIQYGDTITALVVAWMVDLVESGTVRTPDADIKTRARYIKQTALRLWHALVLLKGETGKWTMEQLVSAYTSMMADPTCTDKRGLGAGISSFQLYAHEVWGLPLVSLAFRDFVPDPIPRVQLVHLHEVQLALHWLDSCTDGDGRLLSICGVMLNLLSLAPFRLNELHWVRLENIEFNHDFSVAEIEIYQLPGNPLKTAGSTRRLTITDPDAIHRLRLWLEKRRREGAVDSDLLFGQKMGASLYQRTLVHATLRRVLKAATGDPDMTVHALRHTFASREFARICSDCSLVDHNLMTHLAEHMGHESSNMTIRFYVHSFEDALREAIDRSLRFTVSYTSTDSENLTNTTALAIRKQSSKKGIPVSALVYEAIDRLGDLHNACVELETTDWTTPTPPVLRVGQKERLHATKVWEILTTLESESGADSSEVAHTHDVHISVVEATVRSTRDFAIAAMQRWPRGKRKNAGAITCMADALQIMSIHLGAVKQGKYRALLRRLASASLHDPDSNLLPALSDIQQGEYINISNLHSLCTLLTMLQVLGVSGTDLLVRLQNNPKGAPMASKTIDQIANIFEATLHSQPALEEVDFHGGRPAAYLLWPARLNDHSPRSTEVQGLRVILFCIQILLVLQSQGGHL